ncbi:13978_t:CDS:2 [Funneliformis geosporum]|uniref:3910_t:CDS:1 n=1 Tax=Funneliformis geosporum TaxID=1117311 RepID=A0A9W4SPZ7_9GLOM|nr:13978_t:CDS:2 [Funneliformis geosporum]CAI2177399.1 3910_t:CDS:2 [Funneliformis geosporum]
MTETKKNNRTSCCYPNIQADIVDGDFRRIVEQSFKLWLSVVVTSVTKHEDGITKPIIKAIVYICAWPLFHFFVGHRGLYQAFKLDSLNYFRMFFLSSLLGIEFGLYKIFEWCYGGWLYAGEIYDNFKNDRIIAGTLSAVCVASVLIEIIGLVIISTKVNKYFKTHDDWTLMPSLRKKSRKEQARV